MCMRIISGRAPHIFGSLLCGVAIFFTSTLYYGRQARIRLTAIVRSYYMCLFCDFIYHVEAIRLDEV
jgi:hypothetical protein